MNKLNKTFNFCKTEPFEAYGCSVLGFGCIGSVVYAIDDINRFNYNKDINTKIVDGIYGACKGFTIGVLGGIAWPFVLVGTVSALTVTTIEKITKK